MMGFLHPKRGFRIWSKNEGYFWAHLVCAVLSPETPSILFMVTIRGFEALTGFFSVPWGKIDLFSKKRESPAWALMLEGFCFASLILYGVRVFEILRFFMKTPGWVMHGFRRYTVNVFMYSYLWFFFGFFIFLEVKSERCVDQAAMHIAKPFFQKRAFSFIYLAKTEGLWVGSCMVFDDIQ